MSWRLKSSEVPHLLIHEVEAHMNASNHHHLQLPLVFPTQETYQALGIPLTKLSPRHRRPSSEACRKHSSLGSSAIVVLLNSDREANLGAAWRIGPLPERHTTASHFHWIPPRLSKTDPRAGRYHSTIRGTPGRDPRPVPRRQLTMPGFWSSVAFPRSLGCGWRCGVQLLDIALL